MLWEKGIILKSRDCGTPLKLVEEAQEHVKLTFHSNSPNSTEDVHNFSGNVSLGAAVNYIVENKSDPAKDGASVVSVNVELMLQTTNEIHVFEEMLVRNDKDKEVGSNDAYMFSELSLTKDEEPTSQIIDVTEKADFGNEKTDPICSCKPPSRIKEISEVLEIDAISGWAAHVVQSNTKIEWGSLLNNKGSMFQERLARINVTPLTTRKFVQLVSISTSTDYSIGGGDRSNVILKVYEGGRVSQYNLSGVLISFVPGGIEITLRFCHDALNSFLSETYESMFYPKQLISNNADVADHCVSRKDSDPEIYCGSLTDDFKETGNRISSLEAYLQSFVLERDHISGGLETSSSTHHNLLEKATHFEVENEKPHIRVIGLQEELC
ncbi:hypothetical protein V6N11_051554 [Hibiscus sabdariffa]|uniref:Uncharacterized protein n=1 Tax=Hibiscus sabdariffa TaxID=183260 RepID=A0ABR2U7G8_9ROSI